MISTFERDTSGQLVLPVRLIYGRDAFAQRLRDRFRFFLGEWFLDLRQGAPYYDYLFTDRPDEKLVRLLLRRIIESTPGTLAIRNMQISIDRTARTCTLDDLEVEMSDGETYYSQSETFVVKLPTG